MSKETILDSKVCFRCGWADETGIPIEEGSMCPSCGEQSILSVTHALDILNEIHLSNTRMPLWAEIEADNEYAELLLEDPMIQYMEDDYDYE